MTTTNTDAALQEAVAAINDQKHCFDVTIICTTDDFQSAYWMELLEQGLLQGRKVLAVSEDWASPGGAGNGLGTLYAYQKACKLAAQKYDNFNLAQALADGSVSAALYHTAGKGTRMAPLPASENNNKPGVVSAMLLAFWRLNEQCNVRIFEQVFCLLVCSAFGSFTLPDFVLFLTLICFHFLIFK